MNKIIFFALSISIIFFAVFAQAQSSGVIEIEAEQLYQKYEDNEIAADQLYKGKTLAVIGKVRAIGKTFGDKPYVQLFTGAFSHQVTIYFPANKYDSVLAKMKKDSRVRIVGTCKGKTLGMVVINVE